MTSTASTTLPAFIQAAIDSADQAVTLTLPEIEGVPIASGSVTVARSGATSIRIKHEDGEAQWHTHPDEQSAVACFDADVAHVQSRIDYLNGGGDAIALAISAQTGMPLEMAEALAPQFRAQMEAQEPIPARAVGRAPVPVQVDLDYNGGMYL